MSDPVDGGARQTIIRPVTVSEAFPMRRYLLRPMLPAAASRYPGDDHPAAVHLGAFADLGESEELVGIASFLPRDQAGRVATREYQLQGIVTLPAVRGEGIGARLVTEGTRLLSGRGVTSLWCNGRTGASTFYDRLGFRPAGEEFTTPGTGPHYRFLLDLS